MICYIYTCQGKDSASYNHGQNFGDKFAKYWGTVYIMRP